MEIPVIVGGGLVVIGVGIGIGLTGKGAMEAIGRQPDASGKIQVAALILAALVEGLVSLHFLHFKNKKNTIQYSYRN